MVLYVLDRTETIVSILSNDNPKHSILYTAKVTEKLNMMSELTIECSADSPDSKYIVQENYILFQGLLGDWDMYIIVDVTEKHGDEHTITAICEHASQELFDEVQDMEILNTTQNPQTVLNNIMNGSRWSAGTVTPKTAIKAATSIRFKSTMECLHILREMYNLNVKWRISVSGNKVVSRHVDLLDCIGKDIGKRFEYSKDIASIERQVITTDIKTAIWMTGAIPKGQTEPINFGNVVWSKPGNLLNKPAGEDVLEDSSATALYGYANSDGTRKMRLMYYSDTSITAPSVLLSQAYKVLQTVNKPKVTYTISALDLYAITKDPNIKFESCQLGDIATIIDNEFNPVLQVIGTVISRDVDLLDPMNSVLELGNYKKTLTDHAPSFKESALQRAIDLANINLGYNVEDTATALTTANLAITTVNASTADATNAMAQLNAMANDSIFTPVEKKTVLKEWTAIVSEHGLNDNQANVFGITTEKATYDSTFNALYTYITPMFIAMAVNTTIVGADFRAKFQTYYDARTNLLNAISVVMQTLANNANSSASTALATANTANTNAGLAQADATSALGQVADMSNDNKLTPAEKKTVLKEWNGIVSEYTINSAQGTAFGVTTENTSYDTAYNNLSVYILPFFTNMNISTVMTGSDFRAKFKSYYDSRTTLLNAVATKANSNATTAQTTANTANTTANAVQSSVNDIASDGKLTPSEKMVILKDWNVIAGEKATLDGQATTYSITTEKTNYGSAFTTLGTYLNNGVALPNGNTPSWLSNLTTTENINGATMRTYFQNYYSTKALLQKAITDSASSTLSTHTTNITNAQTSANTAQTTANNIQIGGRNLLMGTRTFAGWTAFGTSISVNSATGEVTAGSTMIDNGVSIPVIPLLTNTNYTLSFKVKSVAPLAGLILKAWFETATSAWVASPSLTVTTSYTQVSWTFNTLANVVNLISIDNYISTTGSGNLIWKEAKLEIGNKATDWTPAPEDVDSAFTATNNTVAGHTTTLGNVTLSSGTALDGSKIQGTLTTGGTNGAIQVATAGGDVQVILDNTETASFNNILANTVSASNIIEIDYGANDPNDSTYYVNSTTGYAFGDAYDPNGTATYPFKYIQDCIDYIYKYLAGDTTVDIVGTFSENIVINGFMGAGVLKINMHTSTLTGNMNIHNCPCGINLVGDSVSRATIKSNGTGCYPVQAYRTMINIQYMILNANGFTAYACYVQYGIVDCRETTLVNGTNSGIGIQTSTGYLFNTKGSNTLFGVNISGGSHVGIAGTTCCKDGTTYLTADLMSTAKANAPVLTTTAVTPSGSNTITATYNVYSTASYRNGVKRTDSDRVYQGQYGGNGNHYGLWSFGTQFSAVSAKTIVSAKLQIKRYSAGGSSSAQKIRVYGHNYSTLPASGTPTLGTNYGEITSVKWGQTVTITLPSAVLTDLASGVIKGFALYESGASPYVIMEGLKEFKSNITIMYY